MTTRKQPWTLMILLGLAGSVILGTLALGTEAPPEFLFAWGQRSGTPDGQFEHPRGIAVDGVGNVYVADTDNHRIQKFTSDGTFLAKWGSYGSGDGQFNSPSGIAVDGAGNVYVADTYNHRIQKFTSDGTFLTQWGSFGSGDGQFNNPSGIAVDGAGNVYVADTYNHRIQVFGASDDTSCSGTNPNTRFVIDTDTALGATLANSKDELQVNAFIDEMLKITDIDQLVLLIQPFLLAWCSGLPDSPGCATFIQEHSQCLLSGGEFSFCNPHNYLRTAMDILVTDPDDGLALIYALSRLSDDQIAAITTVHGNVGLASEAATHVHELLQSLGRDSLEDKVYVGTNSLDSWDYIRNGENNAFVAGRDPTATNANQAVRALGNLANDPAHQCGITLVALGPLTNIATALYLYPNLTQVVDRLYIIAGATDQFDTFPFRTGSTGSEFNAEPNVHYDTRAADYVLENWNGPITLVPLEATTQVKITKREVDFLCSTDINLQLIDLLCSFPGIWDPLKVGGPLKMWVGENAIFQRSPSNLPPASQCPTSESCFRAVDSAGIALALDRTLLDAVSPQNKLYTNVLVLTLAEQYTDPNSPYLGRKIPLAGGKIGIQNNNLWNRQPIEVITDLGLRSSNSSSIKQIKKNLFYAISGQSQFSEEFVWGVVFTPRGDEALLDRQIQKMVDLGVTHAKFWMCGGNVETVFTDSPYLSNPPSDSLILDYAFPEGTPFEGKINWELYDTIIKKLNEQGISPVPLIADGSCGPRVNNPDGPVISPCNDSGKAACIGEEKYLNWVELFTATAALRYSQGNYAVPLWNTENELNWTVFHQQWFHKREGAIWLDRAFLKRLLGRLHAAIHKGNLSAKTTMNINVRDPSWLDWLTYLEDDMDIIGLGAYWDYFTAFTSSDRASGCLVGGNVRDAVERTDKPVMVMETGHAAPRIPLSDSYLVLGQDKYIAQSAQKTGEYGGTGYFFFTLEDTVPPDQNPFESSWGLLSQDLEIKQDPLSSITPFETYKEIISGQVIPYSCEGVDEDDPIYTVISEVKDQIETIIEVEEQAVSDICGTNGELCGRAKAIIEDACQINVDACQSGQKVFVTLTLLLNGPESSGSAQAASTKAAMGSSLVLLGETWEFVAFDESGNVFDQFNEPVDFIARYTDTQLLNAGLQLSQAEALRIYKWDEASQVWQSIGGVPNLTTKEVVGSVSGSGIYQLGVQVNVSSPNVVFLVDQNGQVTADGAFGSATGGFNSGSGADLAEHIPVSEPVGPGDVVELDPARPGYYRKSRGTGLVAGVISSQPGMTLATPTPATPLAWILELAPTSQPEPLSLSLSTSSSSLTLSLTLAEAATFQSPLLALAGRVPVKVTAENGPIRPGDLLTASVTRSGYAMRCALPCQSPILGKALEPLDAGEGLVQMLVMRP